MTRLTRHTRDAIAYAAINFAFDPKEEALRQAEDKLAREAYAEVFPKKETDLIANVPENWFRIDACLKFNVGGQTIVLRTIDSGLPVPYRRKGSDYGGYHCQSLGTIQPGDLCDRIQEHAQTKEKLKEERERARSQIKAMLTSVTTVKKLAEAWPEGEQFYSKYLKREAPQVPTIRVDEINTMLGLPVAA